jgi:hypothetical protein
VCSTARERARYSSGMMCCQVTGNHQGFGFVEFRTEEDAEYAIKVRLRLFAIHTANGHFDLTIVPNQLLPSWILDRS